MSGTFKVDSGGKVEFQEEDGIDYAPVTVQLPGGERVPFLFTVKELSAKGSLDGFGGDFTVPSYRGSSFLDPKVHHAISTNTDISNHKKTHVFCFLCVQSSGCYSQSFQLVPHPVPWSYSAVKHVSLWHAMAAARTCLCIAAQHCALQPGAC